MSKEKFKDTKLTGTIRIKLDDDRVWEADKSVICRHIINVCEDYLRRGYTMTLRQLYYQLVAKDLIPNHDKVYKKIGRIKDDLVYGGEIDWSTFEDRGRVPHIAYFEESIADAFERTKSYYRLDRQLNQNVHVEVWTEKDAISAILKRITSPFTIRLAVNKGYTSSTAIHEAYTRFCDSIEEGKKIKILYFGDHDPSGLDMIRDIRERLIFMFCNGDLLDDRVEAWWNNNDYTYYDIAYLDGYEELPEIMEDDANDNYDLFEQGKKALYLSENDSFEILQIGLTMEQIKEFNPPHNPAKITDPRAKWYIQQFGKVSWEVDAISPEIMENIVRKSILEHIDFDVYEDILDKESKDRKKITKIIKSIS